MLLKFSNSEKSTTFNNGKGKGKAAKVTSRIHRKTLRVATKPGKKAPAGKKISFGKNQKNFQASKNFPPTTTSLCDNSNDSGLGFDESHHHHPTLALINNNTNSGSYHRPLSSTLRYSDVVPAATSLMAPQDAKHPLPADGRKARSLTRPATSSKINPNLTLRNDNEDTCSSDDFSSFYKSSAPDSKSNTVSPSESFYQSSPEKRSSASGSEGSSPATESGESPSPTSTTSADTENLDTLTSTSLHKQFTHSSRDGTVQLQIITQPEQQHRARYQTEGSRGAVKDRSGNGFPVVKLNGYNKPTTLQVFIGNDVGRVSPHIFYQACKVSGKNSTTCYETKTEGTMVIEIELKPENDMTVVCDCVGILKERNVDVEHRLGRNHALAGSLSRNKKKSTKCRMIFRTKINDDLEVLQICSNTITCTQPPGVPEICKKSLDSCSVLGGKELFIIGKNFLKDTKVSFVLFDETRPSKKLWEETVQPDKEYLQQTHLICTVPSFPNSDAVQEPVHVQIFVTSSNKKSEAHNFAYMPLKKSRSMPQSPVAESGNLLFNGAQDTNTQQLVQNVLSIPSWNEQQADNMMPPPIIMPRKASFSKNLPDTSPPETAIEKFESEIGIGIGIGIGVSKEKLKTLTSDKPTAKKERRIYTLKTEFIDQAQLSVINETQQLQDVTTSPTAGLPSSVPVMFNENSIINVGLQNPFVTQETQALMASSQVQDILDGFKMQSNEGQLDLHQIKNEQSTEQVVSLSPTAMLPPPLPQQELNQAEQQQVVENFLNLIVQSTVMNEPNMVATQSHHMAPSDIVLNSPSTVSPSQNVAIQPELVSSSPMIMNSAIAPSSLMCEPNQMMTVQMVQEMNSMENAVAVSNAVSDATAETQAVVKQMIAQTLEGFMSETANEAQSTISNFITNQLSMPATAEQQQMTNTQQLQEMIVNELNAASLIDNVVKKDETCTPQVQRTEQRSLINATPVNARNAAMTQPFSPTTQDLTAMSESDLISFINPSVFM